MNNYVNTKNFQLVIASTVVATVVGFAVAYFFLLSYKSTGLVRLPMSAPDVKPFIEMTKDPKTLRQFVSEQNLKEKEDLFEELLFNAIVRRPTKWIEAIPRLGKQDIKDLGLDQAKPQSEDVIGFRISGQHRIPAVALELTGLQTRYALQVQIKESLEKWVRDTQLTSVGRLERYEASKLRANREIDEIQNRLKEYKRVMQLYPDSARADTRPFLSLEKGSERYLPIPNQMAVIELRLGDIREQMARDEREKKKDELALGFVKQIASSKLREVSIKNWLDESIAIVQKKLETLTDERERIAAFDLLSSFQGLRVSYIDGVSFILQPQLAERPQAPSPKLLAAVFGALGLLLSLLYITREIWYKLLFSEDAEPARTQKLDNRSTAA
jgi:phosphate/sulfate permease